MSKHTKFYGRLGTNDDVVRKITDAQTQAFANPRVDIQIVIEADTVTITVNGIDAMKALEKSAGVWLCMYNPDFYPKPGGMN